ncbi:MAG TPA: DUF559 domain-containing protein [Pseudonocardiaceae bacterium]|nr:DUF559 domain-containing protein [Pseudonocardiaceae bacterium]
MAPGTLATMLGSMHEWWVCLLEPDGLLLRDRALAAVDPDDLLTALRSGRLRRIQRGIYLPRRVEATPAVFARAAQLSSGAPGALPSHATAARVHRIAVPEDDHVQHVTVTRDLRRRNRRDLHFHTRSIGCGEAERRDGVPVTSVARTLADVAASLDRLAAVWAIDDALRRQLCAKTDIIAVIQRWRGGAGCVMARQRLDEADGVAESILETAGRLALLDRGVPLPIPQYQLWAPDGTLVARLDGAYLREKVALEFDGADPHSLLEAVFRDRWRQNGLPELGWTVLRFTWWDVMRDPDGVAEIVQRTLRRRAA